MAKPLLRCLSVAVAMGAVVLFLAKDASLAEVPQGVEFSNITVKQIGTMRIAIARPASAGPHPAVLVLHGTHGFAEEYLSVANLLARAGFVGVAACWFAPGKGEGMRFVTPVTCPAGTPQLVEAASPEAQARIEALLDAVRKIPGVDPERVALMGHSRGAGAALNYVLNGGRVSAVILNSAGYPDAVQARVGAIAVPMLILHGEKDNPADGGSDVTAVDRARAFAGAAKAAGKDVSAHFYAKGGHNSLFTDQAQRRSELALAIRFLDHKIQADRPIGRPAGF